MPVLKTKRDNPEEELKFELEYQGSLSTQQRLEMMFRKSREIKEILLSNGHRKPVEVVKQRY